MSQRCHRCLLPKTYPGITFNDKHICSYCQEYQHVPIKNTEESEKEKQQLKEKFHKLLNQNRGRSTYDCVLLLSGGKDSIYLLYLLTQQFHLNVLSITVDTGLLNKQAKKNIHKAVHVFHSDHRYITPDHVFFKRLYRHYLLHPNKKTLCDSVCKVCQKVINSIALNIAADQQIPFVFMGYSPDQARFFEMPREHIMQRWLPSEIDTDDFSEQDKKYFWNPAQRNQSKIPRVFFPFYALDYPPIEHIMSLLSSFGVGAKRRFHPLNTSCSLAWLMMTVDLQRFGYNPYIKETCELIRIGKANRKKWLLLLTIGTWLMKTGLVRLHTQRQALRYVQLKKDELLPAHKS